MRGGATVVGMVTGVVTDLQVHPLLLHLQHHLNHLQDVRKFPLPVVHLLLKGLDVARGFHGGQGDLVVVQLLEDVIHSPAQVESTVNCASRHGS